MGPPRLREPVEALGAGRRRGGREDSVLRRGDEGCRAFASGGGRGQARGRRAEGDRTRGQEYGAIRTAARKRQRRGTAVAMALMIEAAHHRAGSPSKGIERQARAGKKLCCDEKAKKPNAHDGNCNTTESRGDAEAFELDGKALGPGARRPAAVGALQRR